MKEKRKGIFLLEGVIVAGIFAVFMSFALPFIKQSINLKNTVRKELRYNRNFIYVMENINREIKNSREIKILNDGKLEAIKDIYEDGECKTIKVVYYFTGKEYGSSFIRYLSLIHI